MPCDAPVMTATLRIAAMRVPCVSRVGLIRRRLHAAPMESSLWTQDRFANSRAPADTLALRERKAAAAQAAAAPPEPAARPARVAPRAAGGGRHVSPRAGRTRAAGVARRSRRR